MDLDLDFFIAHAKWCTTMQDHWSTCKLATNAGHNGLYSKWRFCADYYIIYNWNMLYSKKKVFLSTFKTFQ